MAMCQYDINNDDDDDDAALGAWEASWPAARQRPYPVTELRPPGTGP